jgi:hypothetical protein
VLDAGTADFVVDGSLLRIVDVVANDGWSASVERAVSREVEVTFRRGSDRVDLNLELEDGQVRVRIRDRRVDTRTEVRIPADGSTTVPSTTVPSTSPSAEPVEKTLSSAGGVVTVRIEGDIVLLVDASAANGYTSDIRKAGPDEVDVRFESGDAESRVEVRVDDGILRTKVEDR